MLNHKCCAMFYRLLRALSPPQEEDHLELVWQRLWWRSALTLQLKSLVTHVLKDPLTGEMTLEGGALVLADQVFFLFFSLLLFLCAPALVSFCHPNTLSHEAWVALCKASLCNFHWLDLTLGNLGILICHTISVIGNNIAITFHRSHVFELFCDPVGSECLVLCCFNLCWLD